MAGRPRTGEYRNCTDCGRQIYVQQFRLKKDPECGNRCRSCHAKQMPHPGGIPGRKWKASKMVCLRCGTAARYRDNSPIKCKKCGGQCAIRIG